MSFITLELLRPIRNVKKYREVMSRQVLQYLAGIVDDWAQHGDMSSSQLGTSQMRRMLQADNNQIDPADGPAASQTGETKGSSSVQQWRCLDVKLQSEGKLLVIRERTNSMMRGHSIGVTGLTTGLLGPQTL